MKNNSYDIFIRADANPQIGTGHIKRCLVLADFLREEGYNVVFVTHNSSSEMVTEVNNQGFDTINQRDEASGIKDILEVINKYGAQKRLLITDGDDEEFYSSQYQQSVINSGTYLMTITFSNYGHFYSNIIHNQNPLSLEQEYSREGYSTLLRGTEYVILKREYLNLRSSPTQETLPYTILLSFGGADKNDLTGLVVDELRSFCKAIKKLIIVVGSLYTNLDSLKKMLSKYPIPVQLFINTSRMADLMNKADFAITSAGLSTWELSCLGIPDVVISSSEREKISAEYLSKKGYIEYVSHFDDRNLKSRIRETVSKLIDKPEHLHSLSQKCFQLVDGRGVKRVMTNINQLLKKDE
ncbi:UDP-2,4-diacetamido-2,4,6-trideoxy-beta-L-altropyranose hydrolase [Fulvivirga ulvae]|uniref:UDP-2,4-diacetamido-2,4, 6-trideoxy-beta-L-altropyranose hydrolase n=1 Tax=Fulvivirga ulvae TaxID=2904245 RepID=UPI001F37F759|nr:UDP-2,4-diacetamido-2,4,6-trideoxy-beta-L-altropyranose hydrolase [Fulvivirga ulvae]UII30192.1 UDP-2,4-diacetamido-2,4,6-trideoxy-beta-L-altropyranose hydrolase [Fulvivirga ulvae]